MDSLADRTLSGEDLPASLRRSLGRLDRLHALGQQRCRTGPCEGADGLRRAVERHVRELRALAGQPGSPARRGLDVDSLCAVAAEPPSGSPLTAGRLAALARRIPDFDPPAPAPPIGTAAEAAQAAATETHPVVRAALLFQRTAEALGRRLEETGTAARPAPYLRPLPWALASLSLMRSDHPPLAADRRIGGRLDAALAHGAPDDRTAALAELFADLQTAALRTRLSTPLRGRPDVPPPSALLASAVHRRILVHLRHRTGPLSQVLRELDPDASAGVEAADVAEGPRRDRCEAAAERALFVPGPGCRWAALGLRAAGASVELVVTVHDVGGPPTGALAVTASAVMDTPRGPEEVLDPACTDCVTLVPGDTAGDRWPCVEEFVDEAVSRTVDRLARTLP
ncbi:hypothetical protein O4J56_31550 [Nocardiopsis sp. RSe5-2]|uniref:Uncharacterized protein n=1 Tax=Nocardiopsis endophytica TaxID=3018445 RepID=A0ABT4UE86_9ACTN|nr:hypothetical protein [Nocardiopsis endophytica]MDA2815220.1 hypothetical protein [Nocardiopsis endophytica]